MNTRSSLLGALAGLGAGATAMYFLDPDRGARRRAIIRDKTASSLRQIPRAVRVTKQDLANRTRGLLAEATHALVPDDASDDVIAARVRSKMGRVVSHPHAIKVACSDGNITLSGPIFTSEVPRLLKCVKSVQGVRSIDNQLDEHESAEGVSALQGGRLREARAEFLQENWSPAARFVAGTAGAAALGYGFLKRNALGISLGTLGAALLARSATNTELERLLGIGGGRRGVTFNKTINVDAPVDKLFELWSDFERFPEFMENVREVRINEDGQSHWKVAGPAGLTVEWDAATTRVEPNKLIAWKSVEGSPVASAGVVQFQPNDDGTTRIDVLLTYNPPAGAVGHAIAKAFGADPKTQMDQDLMRMKSLVETGSKPERQDREFKAAPGIM